MIDATPELLNEAMLAQMAHAHDMTKTPLHLSDDGRDYLSAALDLASYLLDLDTDSRLKDFAAMLNDLDDEHALLQRYACDGIASFFYELNPPTMGDER